MVTAFHALRTPDVDFCGSRSSGKGKGLLAGETASTQALDPPVVIIPPPREHQQQMFLESPVPMRVGNLGEKASSGS